MNYVLKHKQDIFTLNWDTEDDLDSYVTLMQWVTTNQSKLLAQTLPPDDFVPFPCEKLDSIKTHSSV